MIVALAHTTSSIAGDTYIWVYILIGGVTITGFAITAIRWLKRQAVFEADVRKLVDADIPAQLAEFKRTTRPNGLETDEIGDIAKRSEHKIDRLSERLDQHIGEEREARRMLRRDLDRKADKP